MTPPAIRLSSLTKSYGKARGIVDLDLEVKTGEVFGYLGPNGSGKTTTIRTLLDLIRPTSGTATVLGLDSKKGSLEIRRRVGYLPGDLSLYEALTVRESLEYLCALRGGAGNGRLEPLAEQFELDLTRKVSDLSSGNKQKVGIVQAFAHDPELLVLDEPTAGLDPLMQQKVYQLIDDARDEGRTVFLSSHVLPEVERIAERVGIIRRGRLIEVATVEELKDRAVRVVEVRFGDEPPTESELMKIDNVVSVTPRRTTTQIRIEGSMDALIKALAAHEVVALRSEEADLEEVFLDLYREAEDE
ncbi:MAG: ABC transporter ATP-binding protein [Acidimicrobiia bacterium]